MSKIRINSELENSVTPGSIIVTDNSNEAIYVAPGSNGQVLTVVSGIPQYATPASGSGTLTGANNGLNVVSNVAKLGGTLLQDTVIDGSSNTFGLTETAMSFLNRSSNSFTDTLFGFKYQHHYHLASAAAAANTFPNLFLGWKAGQSLALAGYANTGIGTRSLRDLNGTELQSSSNTALGYETAMPMVFGLRNVILGTAAMSACATGSAGSPLTANIAIGHHSYRTGAGNYQIAIGASAMENSSGSTLTDNIGIGQYALRDNAANFNVGTGFQSLYSNTTGSKNTAYGWGTGQSATPATAGFTENTFIGYNSGGAGAANTNSGGYNTCIGSGAGKNITSGNTNASLGREAMAGVTTGISNIAIGNNAMSTGNWTSSIVIGRNSNVTGDNQLNIGGALYGTSIYSTFPRIGLGVLPLGGICFDASSQTNSIGLPKGTTVSEPLGANVAVGAIRYNTDMNLVTVYTSPGNIHTPISKSYNTQTTTSSSGSSLGTQTQTSILDASVNAITQVIPTVSSTHTNWRIDYDVINSSTNIVTFNFPANTYLNGIIATAYSASNGDRITAECDGTKWIITVVKPHIYQSNSNYNGLNPVLDGERIAFFDSPATGTITLPVAVDGRTLTLVNDSALALTLGTAVKTGNATTTTTLAIGERMTISYDATISQWRKIN